jgi:hypothetical protein
MKITQFKELLVLATIFSACSHSTTMIRPSHEDLAKKESHLSRRLESELQPFLIFKRDTVVNKYLYEMANKLKPKPTLDPSAESIDLQAQTNPLKRPRTKFPRKIADIPLKVFVVQIKPPYHQKRSSFSLPKNQIYLSKKVLSLTEYDSEIAAELAIQIGHLSKQHVYRHWLDYQNLISESGLSTKSETKVPFFGETGFLTFTSEEEAEALLEAVDILYKAGFDPRGLISLLAKFEKHPDLSPYSEEDIPEFLDKIREKIALYVPLRNPIVRTHRFITIQERIQNL